MPPLMGPGPHDDWNVTLRMEGSTSGAATMQRLDERTYDAAGNVSSVTSTPDGQTTPTKAILISYDNNGDLTSYKDASASTTTYTYNIDGDLKTAIDPHTTATYTYNARPTRSGIRRTGSRTRTSAKMIVIDDVADAS